MGQYFYYANLDRQEYFRIGLGPQNDKASGIGRGLGARALGLLLREDGTWSGQRIVVLGDESEGYEAARAGLRRIDSALVLMLFRDDREETLAVASANDGLFVYLGELAMIHGAADVAGALEQHFGADWKKTYGRLRKERGWFEIPPP